ncbi:hypothetical protein ABT093_07765 [Kitasatospora sp. NPDC002551]|uniref:hypothetical protein n=1 Tax=Kitasatospora sp. NPDC002551 TaxID=3154539 RepID=UPI00332A376A
MVQAAFLVGGCPLGQVAQFGDETELHLDQVPSRGPRGVVVPQRSEVAFRLVEVTGTARAEGEAPDGEHLAENMALLGETRPGGVAGLGVGVVPLDLGERGQLRYGLQLSPAVTGFTEAGGPRRGPNPFPRPVTPMGVLPRFPIHRTPRGPS